jgi:hypothetical protein
VTDPNNILCFLAHVLNGWRLSHTQLTATIAESNYLLYLEHIGTYRTKNIVPLLLYTGRFLATAVVQFVSRLLHSNGSTCHDIKDDKICVNAELVGDEKYT